VALLRSRDCLQILDRKPDQEILRLRAQHFPERDCQDENDRFTLASLNVNQWSLMTLDWFAESRAAGIDISAASASDGGLSSTQCHIDFR
jgi:hypothetical protein